MRSAMRVLPMASNRTIKATPRSYFLLTLAAAVLVPQTVPALLPAARAQDQCIPSSAAQAISACPSGKPTAKAKPTGKQPTSHLRAAVVKQAPVGDQATKPGIKIDVADAANLRGKKARAYGLLTREVQLLGKLVRNQRKDARDRPKVLLRLAETYFEMQSHVMAKVRSYDNPIYESCTVKKNAADCKTARQQQQKAEGQLKQVREATIRTYATLAQDHPNYEGMDRVLFSLAFGLEELRQQEQARKVYHSLIKRFPQSPYIPHAYLSFAEFFFQEGEMGPALQFYNKVTEFPPNRNKVYGYALYKSAWAYYNLENYQKSLQSFVEVIEYATKNPNATDGKNLARQSRRELVLPYSMVGSPSQALAFFRRVATDQEQAFELLERLAELYFDTGKWPLTIAVYHQLMAERSSSHKLCYWQSRVTNAVVSSKAKPEQVTELKRLVDIYEHYVKQEGHPPDDVKQCKSETAQVLVWLATSWHREAVGTDESPGTNSVPTMKASAALYNLLVEKFPDMEQLEFPSIDRKDWPTHYRVAYYYAELLWKMEDWEKCGPAFDTVVELNPQGEFTTEAAYAAVLCYNNYYQQEYAQREKEVRTVETDKPARRGKRGRRKDRAESKESENTYTKREFTRLEQGMLDAFRRYRCFIPDSDDLVTIMYREARIYYEANHFEEAALLFKRIAFEHKDGDLAEYAANLYLDSLNVMGTMREPKNRACLSELEGSIQPMYANYCSTDEQRANFPDLCKVVVQLRCDVTRKVAEGYQEDKQYRKAAQAYVNIAKKYRECGRLDEVLYNAALNFEAARLVGRAIKVRQILIKSFPESALSKKAVYLVGANYHALAFYEEAAKYYESFARKFPGEDGSQCTEDDRKSGSCPIAQDALENAIFFRLGLNDVEGAEESVKLFARNFGKKYATKTANVVFALGSIYESAENWPKVIDHYRKFLKGYKRGAAPQQVIQANVKVARAFWNMDDKASAEKSYAAAVRAWGGAPERINRMDGSQSEKILWVREAIDGTAEALFHLAEFKYQAFRMVRFPSYRGGRSLDRINKWAKTDFLEWMKAKQKALIAAEQDYNKVATLKVPVTNEINIESPPWQIAAAARIGQMYFSIIDAVQKAPIPEEIEKDPELFDIYVGAFDEPLEPVRAQAIDKFEFCLKTATNVRWFNQWSNTCETELNRIDPRRYPVAQELRGSPHFVHIPDAMPSSIELKTAGESDLEESSDIGGASAGESAAPAEQAAPAEAAPAPRARRSRRGRK